VPDAPSTALTTYAAHVRPALDRVYPSLRRAAGPRVREVLEAAQMRPGFISDFYYGLLARPMPAASFAAVTTYSHPDMSQELAAGVATVDGDGTWALTESGMLLAGDIQRAIGEGTQEHWARIPAGDVEELSRLLGVLLEAGAATGGAAFAALVPVYEPHDASPALCASTRLGALRHHRADAHRAAWQSAGLTLEELREIEPDSARRLAVEADTNRRDAPIYTSLTEDERWSFLAILAKLP
jgi:hypothetical protein